MDNTGTPPLGGRKILAGANLAVYTAVVIAIAILLNWFVSRHDKRWDLTPNQTYSLSPQTRQLLKGLKQDVTIYAFDRKGAMREARDLLGSYGSASAHVKVRYSDPDTDPSLARRFGVRSLGTIVLASGDRHIEAQGSTEEGISNALIRVLKGQKLIYFVQGHGERDVDGTDRTGYDRVKKALENENYQVKTVVLLQKMEIPADASLLVIAGPHNDYLPQETDTIAKYIAGGGRAIIMLDPGVELPNLSKMLSEWNVTPQNDLVVDTNPVAQIFGATPDMPLILKYGSSPIVQPLARTATLFPLTRSLEISKSYKAGVTDDSLAETSDQSFGVMDFNPKMQSVAFRPGKDVKGPLTVAVSASIGGQGEKKTEGRFVALGTSLLPANVYLNFQANRDFFLNSINWLSSETDLISVRPKPAESQHLNLNQAQMGRLLVLGVFGLPLLIIAIGVVVWWQRR